MAYKRIATLKTFSQFRDYLASIGVELPADAQLLEPQASPFARPFVLKDGTRIGNRFCVLPMEGWDGTPGGEPTDLTMRRWRRFGASGCKLIWGGEAVAVRHDGRANPHQLLLKAENVSHFAALRHALVAQHREKFGSTADLLVGLQLTHSGRFARPNDSCRPEPRILYHHPLLDRRVGVRDDAPLLDDAEIETLVVDFVRAAALARRAGFAFVDLKHCHGYLGHEFLSATGRQGTYGGDFGGRTRFLLEIVRGIRAEVPGLKIGLRLSAFDWAPFHPGCDGQGEPELPAGGSYPFAFGGDCSGTGIDLRETHALLDLLVQLDIGLVCITAGSPYYNPHIQRPAFFPPSDGYRPPEDPLAGVARLVRVTAELKKAHPDLAFVGSAYSYLQEWLPHVAQAVLRCGEADFIGLGRMILSYPELPADVLAGKSLNRKKICRTFSDCTTAPRNGMVSGCYPLDNHYKSRPEAKVLIRVKKNIRKK